MRILSLCLALLAWPFLTFAQIEKPAPEPSAVKGATPLAANGQQPTANGSTRAVVVGISDYQDAGIPDLRFADRDAEAFANFLRSPAGGSLDGDHLKVLTNEQATAGRIAEALDALVERTKEGDRVIIYFSGHGDVERNIFSQPGFLLCWDAPSRVYMGGGTYSLAYLEAVVTTLSVQNKARVTVITDACHAGKLSGSQIGGAQLTSANLAKQYANEIKILSCQPDQYSLEGEQWGGGRGCFSYHLVDGLFGLADRNADGSVTVGEIDRYLEDKVTAEAAPQSQVPMLLGNKTERLATVQAAVLADLQKSKASGLPVFTATEGRGLEDEVLTKLDSGIVKKYFAFKKAVAEKRFFQPADDCAETFYVALSTEPGLAPLHGFLKRNYAAALQDDAQQLLNVWLKYSQENALTDVGGPTHVSQKFFKEKIRSFPHSLDRAADLLGKKHYMYATLKAKKCFFEGYLLYNSNLNPDTTLGDQSLELFRQSLEWQPEQPHVYWQMGLVFHFKFSQPDSFEYYTHRAMQLCPNWLMPCTWAALLLSYKYRQFDRVKPFLEMANRIDSASAEVLQAWGSANIYCKRNLIDGENQLKKAISLDSTDIGKWKDLAYLYYSTRRYAEAEWAIIKNIQVDSTYFIAWNQLGNLYVQTRRYAEAEPVLKKAIELDSAYASPWSALGNLYNHTRRYAEAEPVLKKAIELDSTYIYPWNGLGHLYNQTRRYAEAEPVLKKAIELDSMYVYPWVELGNLYNQTHRYAEAGLVLKKAVELDSTYVIAWNNLGFSYINTRRYAEAESVLKKAIALDSANVNSRKHLGMLCLRTDRPGEARQNFLKALELNPNHAAPMLGMACLLFSEGKTGDALGYIEQAIGKGRTFEQLESDEDLAPLRALPEWKGVMKKHFPDKVKD